MKRILCYGDSNTWGYIPGTGYRHPDGVRWTSVVQSILGPEYTIVEDGINGRTTVFDDPFHEDYLNGFKGLSYALNSAKPLDGVILMLGGNDLTFTDAHGVYKGLYRLVQRILNADAVFKAFTKGSSKIFSSKPTILLISPILNDKEIINRQADGQHRYDEHIRMTPLIRQLAKELNLAFLDAAEFANPSNIDCMHMDAENHKKLGLAIANKVKEIF